MTGSDHPPAGTGPRPDATAAPSAATGLRRWLYLSAGLGCVGLAYLGAVLPGLPTTPWVLLASYCFGRSSPRLQRWVRRSPVFGRLVRDWEDHRGIRRPVKAVAVLMVVLVVSLSLTFRALPVWVKGVIAGFAAVGVGVILFVVPTVRDGRDDPPGGATSA
ncbi:MAG: YbaN family protein [Gemmataceae bacterium]|nr:YbaN family protein [Gemmataceae bacterium]